MTADVDDMYHSGTDWRDSRWYSTQMSLFAALAAADCGPTRANTFHGNSKAETKAAIWRDMLEVSPTGEIGARAAVRDTGERRPDWQDATIRRLAAANLYLREQVTQRRGDA